MSPKDDKVRDLITQEAAEWFVANREALVAKERQEFFAWLRTSPSHVEEYLAYSVLSRDLCQAAKCSDGELAELLAGARTDPDHIAPVSRGRFGAGLPRHFAPRWQLTASILAACAMAGIAWVTWQFDTVVESHLSTRHGQQKSIRLADNSILHLNTDSDVTVRYSSRQRVAILNAGEAEFEVQRDTGRLFRVIAGSLEILDRGTRFNVLRASDATVITVVEGSVVVSSVNSATREPIPVGVDEQMIVADGVWPPTKLSAVDARQSTAWLHRQITFNRAPLDKVAAEFNRYAQKPIEIVTPALKTFEVSGVFSTDDTAAFIAFLRSLDSVRVEETATQIRVYGEAR